MSIPIKTNEIKYTLDCDRLAEKFEIYKITTIEKRFSSGSYMFDSPLLCNDVCSVQYESGRSIYILMNRGNGNKQKLRNAISPFSDFQSVTISSETVSSVPPYLLLQLLLNSLGSYSGILKANNLTGHLYCFHPKWIKHSSKSGESLIAKVPTLELRVSPDNILLLNVRTFTSVNLKGYITFGKKKFESYPRFVFSAKNTLRRRLETDSDAGFILRQTDGDRTEIPFLDLQSEDSFSESKMGVLCDIIENFNAKFTGLAHINLQTVDEYLSVDNTHKQLKESKNFVSACFLENKIKIVDLIGNEDSKFCCRKLCDILKSEYDTDAKIGTRIDKTALNICLIHSAEFYAKYNMADPHNKSYDGVAVQHITIENFDFGAKFAVKTVVQEVLIKKDLTRGKICLYDWSSLKADGNIGFLMSSKGKDDVPHYFCMDIAPDGTFTLSERKSDLFSYDEYSACMEIFDNDIKENAVRGIVRFSNRDINVIRDTRLFTVPEIEQIKCELQSGNTHLRGKQARDALLSSILDIKCFHRDGLLCRHGWLGHDDQRCLCCEHSGCQTI